MLKLHIRNPGRPRNPESGGFKNIGTQDHIFLLSAVVLLGRSRGHFRSATLPCAAKDCPPRVVRVAR